MSEIVNYETLRELLGATSAADTLIKAKERKIPVQLSGHKIPRPFTTLRALEQSMGVSAANDAINTIRQHEPDYQVKIK